MPNSFFRLCLTLERKKENKTEKIEKRNVSHANSKQPQTGWLIPIKIPALFFEVVFTLELDMYIPKVKTKIYCFNLEQ